MPNESLPTRGASGTDQIEERSRQLLRAKLPLNDALITYYPDNYHNIVIQLKYENFALYSSCYIRYYLRDRY